MRFIKSRGKGDLQNMNIAICDDEHIFIDKISAYIEEQAKLHNKQCDILICHRGDKLVELCQKEKVDAVFLDISMPGLNGFETAEKILELRKNIVIVFVSSKEKMVYSSYEYKPFWFVPKSQMSMLEIVIKKLFDKIECQENDLQYINVNVENNRVIEIDMKNVLYFKTCDHYIQIVNKENETSKSYRNKLDNIEEQLSKYWFTRVHSRYLINCRMISTIEKTFCTLINGEKIPISRSKMSHTKEVFQNYLRSIR